MKPPLLVPICRGTAFLAAVVVLSISGLLILDGALEYRRARREEAAIAPLETRSNTQAPASILLAKENEVQTVRSVERQDRNRALGWTLLVSVVAFLSSAKGYQTLQGGGQPELVTIGSRRQGGKSKISISDSPVSQLAQREPLIDLDFVDSVIESKGRNREAAIPILQALQKKFRYLPEGALRHVCEKTEIAPAQIVGVASFYSQFRRQPVGRRLVRVCHGTACHVAGIDPIMDELRRRLDIPVDGDTDIQRRFTLESVNCLGCCSLAPVMMVEDHVAARLTPTRAWQELEDTEAQV